MEELIKKFKSNIPLSSEAEAYLFSIAIEKRIAKGDVLIRQGQVVKHTYFVTQGCLRSYSLDKNGKDHTLQFAVKDWWISDFIAIYNNQLAILTVEAITDSKVIAFDAKELEKSFTLFPEFEAMQRRNLQRHVASLHTRILNQMQLTAAERYQLFLTQYPDIEQYTPNYNIASYLGITQQSLSRIRVDKAKK